MKSVGSKREAAEVQRRRRPSSDFAAKRKAMGIREVNSPSRMNAAAITGNAEHRPGFDIIRSITGGRRHQGLPSTVEQIMPVSKVKENA